MTKFETLISAVAAVLAALVYIARKMRAVAAAVDFWARLPAEHANLMAATEANTEAIRELREAVRVLTAVVERGPRPGAG